jgi:TRAP-type C4-dicarboxylate transport system permease small subunit
MPEAFSARPPPSGLVARLATLLTMAGGIILLATAALSTVSVLSRWLLGWPIPGDFELIAIGSGLGAFGFLAFGTLARSNILVDTLTTWLPARVNQWIDAFWSLVWALALLVLAERMAQGAAETAQSGTTTMVLGLSTWWAVGIGAFCIGVTALVAFRWVVLLARGRG